MTQNESRFLTNRSMTPSWDPWWEYYLAKFTRASEGLFQEILPFVFVTVLWHTWDYGFAMGRLSIRIGLVAIVTLALYVFGVVAHVEWLLDLMVDASSDVLIFYGPIGFASLIFLLAVNPKVEYWKALGILVAGLGGTFLSSMVLPIFFDGEWTTEPSVKAGMSFATISSLIIGSTMLLSCRAIGAIRFGRLSSALFLLTPLACSLPVWAAWGLGWSATIPYTRAPFVLISARALIPLIEIYMAMSYITFEQRRKVLGSQGQ